MPWIRGFLWDDENVEHIGRHGVSPDEVEEVLSGNPLVLRGRDGRHLAYGPSLGGRYLFAVYVSRRGAGARVLTARDMTEKEKRLYRAKRRRRG